MEFKRYENIEEFGKENLELLLEKEWLNNLIVGNYFEGLKKGAEGWLLGKVTDKGKTELIILYRKPYRVLLATPTDNTNDELYKFAANEVYKIDQNILGVNTEKEIANKFARYYCELAGLKFKPHMELRILLLTKLNEPKLNNDLIFRKANINDKQVLVNYIDQYYREAVDEIHTKEELEERFERRLQKGDYVLEKNGKIVCQAALTRDLQRGKCVSGVFTPTEERGKGYAYNLVYRITEQELKNGAEYCVLFTDNKNPISNHVYEKIGYKKMVDCEDLHFYM